jgi:hypothetical protein
MALPGCIPLSPPQDKSIILTLLVYSGCHNKIILYLGWLNRKFFSYNSVIYKSEIKVCQQFGFFADFFLHVALFLCIHMVPLSPLCGCMSGVYIQFSSNKDSSPTIQLNYLFKVPISK